MSGNSGYSVHFLAEEYRNSNLKMKWLKEEIEELKAKLKRYEEKYGVLENS